MGNEIKNLKQPSNLPKKTTSNLKIIIANKLIETPLNLTTFEQRLILYAIALFNKKPNLTNTVEIYIPDFREVVGISQSYNNKIIKEKLQILLKKEVILLDSDLDHEPLTWFETASVNLENSKIKLCFNMKITSYLENLKGSFTSFKLESIIRFHNKYSFKLYQLLKQYEFLKMRLFSIEQLRFYLGIKDSEYTLFKNFRSRILNPAQKEINQASDLKIQTYCIYHGKKIIGVEYYIKRIELEETTSWFESVQKYIPEEHQEKTSVQKILKEYYQRQHQDINYLIRNLKYTSKNAKKNYRLYLTKALENDWGLTLEEDEKVFQEKKSQELKMKEKLETELQKEQKLQEQKRQATMQQFYALPKSKQEEIENQINQQNNFFKMLPKETRLQIWMETNFQI